MDRLFSAAVTFAAFCLSMAAWGMGESPGPAAVHAAETPEAQLVNGLLDVVHNRLDSALGRIDRLLQSNPNFRLAHLVKGDILLARTRSIATLGGGSDAPTERLEGLREEAVARVRRFRQVVTGEKLPAYLLQLDAKQKYAVVVDAERSTLYVFENRQGTPRYLADYYISIGRNGVRKAAEGDRRTPLGVYQVVASLPKEKLADFYGDGAFPINYPNEWDRRHGRKGHGIWLHGTPSDTYSRPPMASDGCIVLSNQDLRNLTARLQVGSTPVVIAERVEWVDPASLRASRKDLLSAVESWRKDWESRDMGRYLGHYSAKFSGNGLDFKQWAKQKQQVNQAKRWIKIRIGEMGAFLYPGREQLAVVDFVQDYASSNLSQRGHKRQYWLKEGSRWKIVYEGAA